MKIAIGKFNAETRQVPVTFTQDEVEHKRDVNAVLDEAGAYDRKATKARVEEVAAGVAVKIAAGVIGKEPPAPPAPPVDQADQAPAEPAEPAE